MICAEMERNGCRIWTGHDGNEGGGHEQEELNIGSVSHLLGELFNPIAIVVLVELLSWRQLSAAPSERWC